MSGVKAGTPEAALLAACEDAGKAAGSWVIDGNTSDDTARAILAGIQDGDPAVLDALPAPMWSGEWADEPTYGDLAREHGLTCDEADSIYGEAVSAFTSACEDEVERACNAVLGYSCSTCGRYLNPAARMLGPLCLPCVAAAHRSAVGG